MKRFVFLWLLLAALPAHAFPPEGAYVGLGAFFANPLRYTASSDASHSIFGRVFTPELGLGYSAGPWRPSLHWAVLGRSTGDGEKRETLIRANIPYAFFLSERFEAKAGGGLMWFHGYGPGGEVELRNGALLQKFYVPDGSSNTFLFYLAGGAALKVDHFRFDFDLYFTSLLSRRRAAHYSLGAGYVF
jgi:hypothetical protein